MRVTASQVRFACLMAAIGAALIANKYLVAAWIIALAALFICYIAWEDALKYTEKRREEIRLLQEEICEHTKLLLMAHQEMDALHAKLARMSAPVSGYEHLEYSDGECNLYEREDVNALIAARAQEVKHG